ncbi:MAG: PKD domain-containing protein [Opitutales bacterium]|nr:PKD domain-containing protein [Opitutales bacterium]
MRSVFFLAFLSFLAGSASLSAQFDIDASSYLGGSGSSSRVTGSVIQADGTIVLAANLANAELAALATHVIGVGGNGAIVRLSPDGRQILSVTRLADVVHDLATDRDDNLYVAAGTFGFMKLNGTADELLWTELAGSTVWRVDAGDDGHSAVVVPSHVNDNSPGEGTVHVFAPDGDAISSFGVSGNLLDVAVDSRTQTVVYTGWYNIWTYNGPYSRGYAGTVNTPVDVPFTHGVPYNYGQPGAEMKWRLHNWQSSVWIDQEARIPNQRYINYPFSTDPSNLYTQEEIDAMEADEGTVTGWYQYLLDMPKTFTNNMADTRSYRVVIGRDGKLYVGSEADGGNSPLRWDGEDLSKSAPWTASDGYFDVFFDTGTVPKLSVSVYELRTDSVVWLRSLGFTNRLTGSGHGTSDNTIHMQGGGLAADEAGRLYISGRAFFGFYLPANTAPSFSIPRHGEVAFDPFEDDDPLYTGGSYLLVYSPDFRTRLYSTRVAGGQARTVDARTMDTLQSANFVWGGFTGPSPHQGVNKVHLVNPVQENRLGPNDGTNGWFTLVQGEAAEIRALADAAEVQDPASPVLLDGARSFSLDGYINSWTWTDLDEGRVLSREPTASLNLPEGAYNLGLTVTDSLGGTDSTEVRVFVTEDDPMLLPSFDSTPPADAVLDWPFAYTASVSTGSATNFVGVSGAPDGLALTDHGNGTATLAGSPASPGTYWVTLLAEANGHTKSQTWLLTVYDGGLGGTLLDDDFTDFPGSVWGFASDSDAAGKPSRRWINQGIRLTSTSVLTSRGYHQGTASIQSSAHYYTFPQRENITDATLSTTGIHRHNNNHPIVRALVGYDDGSGMRWAVSNQGIQTTSGGFSDVTPVPGAWNLENFTWSSVDLESLNSGAGAALDSALVLENARAIGMAHLRLDTTWQANIQPEMSSLTLTSHRDTLPTKPPVVTTSPRTSAVIGEPYSYDVGLDDPEGLPVTVSFESSAPSWLSLSSEGDTHTLSGTPDASDAGLTTVTLVATNSAGAKAWQSFALMVVPAEAPVFTVTPSPVVDTGATFSRQVRAVSSVDSSLLELSLENKPDWLVFQDFGNGFGELSGTAPDSPTSHELVLVASDGIRETPYAFTLQVQIPAPNIPPTAVILPSTTHGFAPLEVFLSGSPSSDADGFITGYQWHFGEGTTASGESVSFTFTEPGKYTVQLTVEDDRGGTDTTSVGISVRAPGTHGPVVVFDDFATNTVSEWNTRGFDEKGRAANFTWSSGGHDGLDTSHLDAPGILRVVPNHNGDSVHHMHKIWKSFDRMDLSGATVFSDGLYAVQNNFSKVDGFLIGYEVDGETRWAITSTNVIQHIGGSGVTAERRSWALNNFSWRALDWDDPLAGRGDPVPASDVIGNAVSFGVYSRIEHTWLITRGLQTASLELYAPHEAFPTVTSAPVMERVQSGSEFSHMLAATSPGGYAVSWDVVEPLPEWLTLENLGGGMARLVGTPPPETAGDHLVRLKASTNEVGPTFHTFLMQIDPHTAIYNMGMRRIPDGLRMEWFGYSGVHYQLQVSDDLKEWTDLGPARQGTDEPLSHEKTLSNGDPRFFRILYGW